MGKGKAAALNEITQLFYMRKVKQNRDALEHVPARYKEACSGV